MFADDGAAATGESKCPSSGSEGALVTPGPKLQLGRDKGLRNAREGFQQLQARTAGTGYESLSGSQVTESGECGRRSYHS